MSNQIKKDEYSDVVAQILDLEKKYYEILEGIILSKQFYSDLMMIEKTINEKYEYISANWDLTNKFKTSAERLVRYYSMKKLKSKQLYATPISSDIGLVLEDAIINIDVKTDQIKTNSSDARNTLQFESNQASFINKHVGKSEDFDGIETLNHLPTLDSNYNGLPVLTYFLKILYVDDSVSKTFEICREKGYPTVILSCVPNGELSTLFDNDIISGCKTYEYYNSGDLAPKFLRNVEDAPKDAFTNKEVIYHFLYATLNPPEEWKKITISNADYPYGYFDTKKVNGKPLVYH